MVRRNNWRRAARTGRALSLAAKLWPRALAAEGLPRATSYVESFSPGNRYAARYARIGRILFGRDGK